MINSLIATGKNVVLAFVPVLLDVIMPFPTSVTSDDLNYHELIKLKLMIVLLALAIVGQLVIIIKNIFRKGKPPVPPTAGDLIGN